MKKLNQAVLLSALAAAAGCHHPATPPTAKPSMATKATAPTPSAKPSTKPMIATTGQSAYSVKPHAIVLKPTTAPTTKATIAPIASPIIAIKPTSAPVTRPVMIPRVAEVTTKPAPLPATMAVPTQPAAPVAVEPPLNPAPAAKDPLIIQSDVILAEHLAGLAQSIIPHKVGNADAWVCYFQQSAALLAASSKLDPNDARFPRLQVDALLRIGETDAAMTAMTAVRKADPNDQFTQVALIDLYTDKLESAVDKASYLKDLLGRPNVPAPVRAHAGVQAAKFLVERGEPETARNVLAEALRLNPSSPEGLRLRYEMLPATVSRFERAEALMAILKANPAQPKAVMALADQVAASGLAKDSLPWFDAGSALTLNSPSPDFGFLVRNAAELVLADKAPAADQFVNRLIQVQPNEPANWFLNIITTRETASKDDAKKVIQEASNALSNRLADVINDIAGKPVATTRPITLETAYTLPDLKPTVEKLNKDGTDDQKQAFIVALTDLATLQIFFAEQPAAGKELVDTLAGLIDKDNTTADRLRAWSDYLSGKTEDARVAFTTIADRDPMAQLGLVKITATVDGNHERASSMGRKLLSENPSGLLGATLYDAMRDLNVKLVTTAQADALKEELDKFPKDWLHIIDQSKRFYTVRVEPTAVARSYGEPLLARLTIQNLTDADLTIGDDGILKRDLWFSADVKGSETHQFGGVAYDRIAGPLVINGRQSSSQIVRLDQGVLRQYMESNPAINAQVTGNVIVNPVPHGSGQMGVGPAGAFATFSKLFNRTASPIQGAPVQQALNDLNTGSPAQKINSLNLLRAYALMIRGTKDAPDTLKQNLEGIVRSMRQARADENPSVSAWAGFLVAALETDVDEKNNIVREMVHDPDWRHRQIALVLIPLAETNVQRKYVQQLLTDPEPSVRASAKALNALLDIPNGFATTAPATTAPVSPAPIQDHSNEIPNLGQ